VVVIIKKTEMKRTFENAEELGSCLHKEIGTSDWIEISQKQIADFAQATGDFQWIHLDEERAKKESPFGTTIAHGFLILSMIPVFFEQVLEVNNVKLMINYGLNKVRFMSPVPAGGRIRLKATLADFNSTKKGKKATIKCEIELEGSEKLACLAENVLLIID
jgi:acyl dehydratase